jgi:hypothetical protein
MGYDDANKYGRRTQSLYYTGTGTKGGAFSKQRLKAVAAHFRVHVAGTAAANVATLYNGTTSIGAVTLGTSAIGTTTSVDLGDATIDSLAGLTLVTASDATIQASCALEYDVLPDSAFAS